MSAPTSEHERKNRAHWDSDADAYQEAHETQLAGGKAWGVWSIPEAEVGALGSVRDLSVLELGCGAAQWAIALAPDARRIVGLDQSDAQLRHALANATTAGARVPLTCASGEAVPLRDESFDLVFCDHGAMSFCDPDRIVPECARLLRTGGRLVFNHATLLHSLCYDAKKDRQTDRLLHSYHDAEVFDWPEGTVDFHRTFGGWVRCFRDHGFVVDDLIELVPSAGATSTYDDFAPVEWARRWPAEEIWVTRKAQERS
ncbi:MAG: class I SAM-dependent methyltransferase [Acidimicrobiia bacterium]